MPEPRTWLPLDEHGHLDAGRVAVQLVQHLPGQTADLAAWCGGTEILVNGGPAVLLPGTGGAVGLGDYARLKGGRFTVEYADGLARRYTPADQEPG